MIKRSTIGAVLFAAVIFSADVSAQLLTTTSTYDAASPGYTATNPFRNNVFIANNGQFDCWDKNGSKVFYGINNGAEMFRFTANGVYLRLFTYDKYKSREDREEKEEAYHRKGGKGELLPQIYESFVNMEWVGASAQAYPEAEQKESSYFTYALKAADGSMSGTKADVFKKIIYRNLYPGIDVEYTIPDKGGIKYNLIVHPGADVSQVKIRYKGDVTKMNLLRNGSLQIQTANGNVTENAPATFYEDGTKVKSSFVLNGDLLSFVFPAGYDNSKTLVVDPWIVTSLANMTTSQRGYDVDLDNAGNLYVYGGGDPNGSGTPAYEVAKYDPAGNLLWTFGGVIVTPSWTSSGVTWFAPGNFLVERTTGKTYLCQAYSNLGSQLVRIDASGNYDNFISIANTIFEEGWDMAFDCSAGQIYAIGGGTTSNINFGVVNTTTGVVTSSNITGTSFGAGEDVMNVTMDPSGNMYCIIASGNAAINNYIYRVNSTFNGNVWNVYSGYGVFTEGGNRPYLPGSFGFNGNGHNSLGATNQYVYYYDGFNLKALNSATGVTVGVPTTIAGYQPMYQGGVATDECNNIYIGGVGQIHMYTFNGTTFVSNGTIGLGAGLSAAHVHDVRYDMSAHRLFVSGEGFVGVYSAIASLACNNLSVTANVDCSGNGTATVTTSISNPIFTYTWYDANGNIVATTTGSSSLTNSVTGLSSGAYVVTVQINPLCGGPLAVDSISAGVIPMTLNNLNNVSCFGAADGSVNANVTGGQPPITYSWSTTPVQTTSTASGLGPGTYTCTVADATGCTGTLTVTITQPALLTATLTGTQIQCASVANTLTATPTGGTGTYTVNWNPGGPGTSITVNPTATTTYTCTVTDQNGCTYIDSFLVTVQQMGIVDLSASPDGCAPWTVNFTDMTTPPATGSITGWFWDFGDGNTSTSQNPSHTYTTAGNYNVTLVVTFTGGCTGTAALATPVIIYPTPVANFSVSELGGGQYTFTDQSINAVQWSWNFGDGNTSTDQNPTHTYNVGAVEPPVVVELIVASAGGCMDTIEIPVDVRDFTLYIPNTFTPNGNGVNEGFIPVGIGVNKFEMWIFDRWGMLLYHCTDINQPWDGTFRGSKVQMDTYVYKVKVTDVFEKNHTYIGHVNVLR